MRIEAHQVFNVSVQLCEFFNVDLSDRGYYQIRLRPRKSPEIWSVDISHDPEGEREFSGPNKPSSILQAHVYQGAAISKTVEVTYQHEHFKLEDWFHISVQFNSTLNLCEVQKVEIEVELMYMDRYHPPQYESFEKITKRVVEIPLDPTRLVAAARSLYFDSSYLSAVTMCVYSSLVMVATRQKRGPVDTNISSSKSTKLRRVYNSSAHALLFATRSIQQFIVNNSKILNSCVSVAVLDVQSEMQTALLRFDTSDQSIRCLETDISEWSTKITLIFQQMLHLFRKSNELRQQLLLVFDKQRRAVFREAFWINERSIEEVAIRTPVSMAETYKSVTKSEYLKKLPRTTIFCEETDCPGEYCPIIFEDNFSRHPDLTVIAGHEPNLPTSASMPAIKPAEKHKSFREKLRKETRKLIHPRRKSLDCSQSLSRKVIQSRNRTKTLQNTTTDGVGLLAPTSVRSQPIIEQNLEKTGEDGESVDTPSFHSEPAVSPTSPSSSSSEFGRCSAAGETSEAARPLISKESVTSSEIANALRTSASADDVLSFSSNPATSELGMAPDGQKNVAEEDPKEIMAAFELLREREAAKRNLREEVGYDGVLYSEKSGKSANGPVFSPISSTMIAGEPIRRPAGGRTHLVVFVHGLEGSQDDLVPFRCGLDQSLDSYYHTLQLDTRGPIEDPWTFDYLMSSANKSQTWADIKTMAHNLLAEVREYVEESTADIQRISFLAHSLGGVIVRSAVGMVEELEMEWMADKCHTLMTINSPHLGLAYVQKHIHWGVQIVKWWKKSRSMEQLTFRDSLDFTSSFVYQVSVNGACGKFKHVILVGTPYDQLVPYMSALLVPSKNSLDDQSQFGETYREMMAAILNSMKNSPKTETLVRYTTFHQLGSTNTQKLTGRAAHVVALEDSVFIEKLFSISAHKYFV